MTLKRLRIIAIVVPILGVISLEAVRYLVIGAVSWQKRLSLDLVMGAAIFLFAFLIFGVIEKMQSELRRRNHELLALHEAALSVTADLSRDLVLKKVVEHAKSLVGAKYGALSVVDDQNRILSFITSGVTQEEREAIGPPPVGHGMLGVVLHEGQHLRLADLTRHPRSVGFPAHHPPMHSLLAVPVPCKGPFLGNLYLTEKVGGAEFTQEDEDTLERFALQAALAIDNAHLHEQVADLAVAQERLRISHEMHDGLAQILGYVNTKVQAAQAYLKRDKTDDAETQLRELANAARHAYTDVRESIVGLRTLPRPRQPFGEALQEYIERWQEMSTISTSLTIDSTISLRTGDELQLVRIVQEALTNIRKHAKASHARVEITQHNGEVVTVVSDDGVGFSADRPARGEFPSFGLTTMRERAESIGGTLTIVSVPGSGTTVRVTLPIASVAQS